jgi:hypothetical protein
MGGIGKKTIGMDIGEVNDYIQDGKVHDIGKTHTCNI